MVEAVGVHSQTSGQLPDGERHPRIMEHHQKGKFALRDAGAFGEIGKNHVAAFQIDHLQQKRHFDAGHFFAARFGIQIASNDAKNVFV